MLFELAAIIFVVLLIDHAGFWKVGNWSRNFRGKSPNFTYRDTMFPRLFATLLGCVAFLFAKHASLEWMKVVLFVVSMTLISSSHGYLWLKAWRTRFQ